MTLAEEIAAAVDGPEGYWVGALLSKAELADLEARIARQWLTRLRQAAPQRAAEFAALGMGRYHQLCHLVEHGELWTRDARLFEAEDVEAVRRGGLLRATATAFGGAEVTNEVRGGLPEIYWRLVRPRERNDVGPLHADSWFWKINGWPVPSGRRTVKVWSFIVGEAGQAGLEVVPGSHRQSWSYGCEARHGMAKPTFDAAGIDSLLLRTPPGTSVVFHEDLLHGGAVTQGDSCRVSFEFTIFSPKP